MGRMSGEEVRAAAVSAAASLLAGTGETPERLFHISDVIARYIRGTRTLSGEDSAPNTEPNARAQELAITAQGATSRHAVEVIKDAVELEGLMRAPVSLRDGGSMTMRDFLAHCWSNLPAEDAPTSSEEEADPPSRNPTLHKDLGL